VGGPAGGKRGDPGNGAGTADVEPFEYNRHSQPCRQACAGLTPQSQAELRVGTVQPGGGPGMGGNQVREAFREDPARTVSGGTEESAGRQP
jgi:hypothetical protein